MAQEQTGRAERGIEPLKCTSGDCQELQCEHDEFCKLHSDLNYFMTRLLNIAEEFFPRYSSSDFIAECEDYMRDNFDN